MRIGGARQACFPQLARFRRYMAVGNGIVVDNMKDYVPREGCGIIYMYTLDNGERYIGQTKFSLRHRHKQHARCKTMVLDRKIKHHEYELTVIDECRIEDLDMLEVFYIKFYNTMHPNGLNQMEGGKVCHTIPEHVRKKMSESAIGRPKSVTARHNMSASRMGVKPWNFGVSPSEETRRKISESLKHPYSDNDAENTHMRKKPRRRNTDGATGPVLIKGMRGPGLIEYYKTHDVWNKGIPCDEQVKKKISDKLKGRKLSEETRRKMGESKRGKKRNPDHISKAVATRCAKGHTVKVICIETNKIYPSIQEAIRDTGASERGIRLCLKGMGKTSGKMHWELYKG